MTVLHCKTQNSEPRYNDVELCLYYLREGGWPRVECQTLNQGVLSLNPTMTRP